MGRRARTTVVGGTASLLVAATATFGAGAASAEPSQAQTPLLGECGDTIEGEPGTPVKVAGVKLGEIPETGEETLTGEIPVVQNLPLAGRVTQMTDCSVTAVADVSQPALQAAEPLTQPLSDAAPEPLGRALDSVTDGQATQRTQAPSAPAESAAPRQEPEQQPTQSRSPVRQQSVAPPQQFGPFAPADFNVSAIPQRGVYDFGDVSYFDYTDLFSSSPAAYGGVGGSFGSFGQLPRGSLFDSSPDFQVPSSSTRATERDVAAAGQAQALPTQGSDRVALPVLVAVLALSGVSAALVRTWVHGVSRSS